MNKLYACEVSRHDHLINKETEKYSVRDYEQNPSSYRSTFAKKIAPYASVIINGIYWDVDSPKLLTIPDAKYLLQPAATPWLPTETVGSPALPHRMLAICDISADPGGSIEFMNECTTIDTPFCLYDADRNKDVSSFKGPGVLVCSIDNMPTQLPRESTDFFGDLLLPYVPDILQSDASKPLEEHEFSGAVKGVSS
jgi:alpha-aminoadipic semialdehyde synthase